MMTRRDLAWRAGGVALFVTACGVGVTERSITGDLSGSTADILLGLVSFLLAITGIVLLVQGKRVPMSWLAERRRQRAQTMAIQPGRQRRAIRGDGRVRSSR